MLKDESLDLLLQESIKTELLVSDLYLIFYKLFDQDSKFWWKIALEEKDHASILRSSREIFSVWNHFPQEVISENLSAVTQLNQRLESMILSYQAQSPSREDAFNTAVEIEQIANEDRFQKAMEKHSASKELRILQKLNGSEKNHAPRILSYMNKHDIPISESS